MGGQHLRAEAGFCAESGRSPVQENVICYAGRFRQLRSENPDQHVWALGKICGARDHYRWSDLGFLRSDKDADHYVAGL